MARSTSHLAGAPITVDGRFHRQLCQWCGHRLHDMDLRNIAFKARDGEGFRPPEWEVGVWVRADGPMSRVVEVDDGKMPGDACMRDVSPLLRATPNSTQEEP